MDFRLDDKSVPLPKPISTELLVGYVRLVADEAKTKAETIKALKHGIQYLEYVIDTFQNFKKEIK